MYVCVCVCMRVYVCVCLCVCVQLCICVCVVCVLCVCVRVVCVCCVCMAAVHLYVQDPLCGTNSLGICATMAIYHDLRNKDVFIFYLNKFYAMNIVF